MEIYLTNIVYVALSSPSVIVPPFSICAVRRFPISPYSSSSARETLVFILSPFVDEEDG